MIVSFLIVAVCVIVGVSALANAVEKSRLDEEL